MINTKIAARLTSMNEALTPAELIEKHSLNPKHKITDDEMRNLKIGYDSDDKKELKADIEAKEAEDDFHNNQSNTYDILDA